MLKIIRQDNITKDLPQLIVGLDSINDDANYIHIADVKEDTLYYCPCCKGVIKPRAFKKDKDYMVQPHFYHESEGCSEESFVHYICKSWLFEKGCKFKVDGVIYTVSSIETEQTLQTQFGNYQPDIVVHTERNKTFFFEIKYSNKKTALYAPKWDELGNDVVEVDAREFINNKHDERIPEFKLIYSDGECFIKSYSHTDYEDSIAKRKLEWKRQDKLNYKIQWERLDWFWKELQEFKAGNSIRERVIETFSIMEYADQVWCYLNIKGKSCLSFKTEFAEIINSSFIGELISLKDSLQFNENIAIGLNHISPLIYIIEFKVNIPYLDYECREVISIKKRTTKGILLLATENEIQENLLLLKKRVEDAKINIKRILEVSKIQYVSRIVPYSHHAAREHNFSKLRFNIYFEDNIHSPYTKELIGKSTIYPYQITSDKIEIEYSQYRKDALNELNNTFAKYALKNNSDYMAKINSLILACNGNKNLDLRTSNDYRRIWLLYKYQTVLSYEFKRIDTFDNIGTKVFDLFYPQIEELLSIDDITDNYVRLINSCPNAMWKIYHFGLNTSLFLEFMGYKEKIEIDILIPQSEFAIYLKTKIHNAMISLTNGLKYDVRVMEVE